MVDGNIINPFSMIYKWLSYKVRTFFRYKDIKPKDIELRRFLEVNIKRDDSIDTQVLLTNCQDGGMIVIISYFKESSS